VPHEVSRRTVNRGDTGSLPRQCPGTVVDKVALGQVFLRIVRSTHTVFMCFVFISE